MNVQAQPFWVNASQPQHTPAGNLLFRMYYQTNFLDALLSREQRDGYPHNGGEHTLNLKLTLADLRVFLDLVLETFKSHEGAVPFVESVKERFRKAHPSFAAAL